MKQFEIGDTVCNSYTKGFVCSKKELENFSFTYEIFQNCVSYILYEKKYKDFVRSICINPVCARVLLTEKKIFRNEIKFYAL